MSDILPPTGPVASVQSVSQRSTAEVRVPSGEKAAQTAAEAGAPSAARGDERIAVASDYARIQADIADVVARIEPSPSHSTAEPVETAERALLALMPAPVVMLPMPPTDPHIVAFVAQVAQSVAQQAAQARAAQAHATPVVAEAAAA